MLSDDTFQITAHFEWREGPKRGQKFDYPKQFVGDRQGVYTLEVANQYCESYYGVNRNWVVRGVRALCLGCTVSPNPNKGQTMQTGNTEYNLSFLELLAKLQGNAEVRAEAAKWVDQVNAGIEPDIDENYETGMLGAMHRAMGLDPDNDLCFDAPKIQRHGDAFEFEVTFALVDLTFGPFKVVI